MTTHTVLVEIYYSAAWNDISAYVYQRDAVTVRRGRSTPGQSLEPGQATLTLDNRDGRFSPRNPTSPLYGLIGRNTQLRISMDGNIRFVGEISEWPVTWGAGDDVYVPIEVSVILRRLGQGASPIQSSLRRAITGNTSIVAYWPCEDGANAKTVASGMDGVQAMTIVGTPEMGAYSDFVGSAELPSLGTGKFTGKVPVHTNGLNQVRLIMAFPAASTWTTDRPILSASASGTVSYWSLYYETGGALSLRGYGADDVLTFDSGAVAFDVDGKKLLLAFTLDQNGADIDYEIETYEQEATIGGSYASTFAAATLGHLTRVSLAPERNLSGAAAGHIVVDTVVDTIFDETSSFNAHTGESARDRSYRLCTEEGVSYAGTDTTCQAMGYQARDTLVNLLRECEAVDGIMYEIRASLGLAHYLNVTNVNDVPTLTLDYATDVMAPFLPTEDDATARNDVTVERYLGGSGRVQETAGPLGITAIGRYDEQVTLSLAADTQCEQQAAWRVHWGTWDEVRYASVTVNLTRTPAVAAAALTCSIKDVILVEDLPAWMPPNDARLFIIGYEETLTPFEWVITFNTVPAGPLDVFAIEDTTYGRLDSSTTTISEDLTTAETDVSITGDTWIDSGVRAGDFPFDVMIGGERMTVTACTGSPQVFTVTRSVNGVVKTHATGASVALVRPVAVML
ncbi:MAG: hypothetical protein ACOYBY_17735 [Dermatophilaceae bacterium]